jgi:adenylate cyclase
VDEPINDDAGSDDATRLRRTARAIDNNEKLFNFVRRVRSHLPGDQDFGDPLSTARFGHLAIANEQWTDLTETRPGVVRELGRGALQVWQSVLEARGADHGDVQLTILFTDLVNFSTWALQAGDDDTLALLREVAAAIEPPVKQRGGQVVKRLGDGMMAVFTRPQNAFDAVIEANDRLAPIKVAGYRPKIRAGMHTGNPRKLGGDYLGVDVNIAARVAQKAAGGEILASQTTVDLLDHASVAARRKRTFAFMKSVKGVPDELEVYTLTAR